MCILHFTDSEKCLKKIEFAAVDGIKLQNIYYRKFNKLEHLLLTRLVKQLFPRNIDFVHCHLY